MATRVDVAIGRRAKKRPSRQAEMSQPLATPGWMGWTTQAAVLWALAYGAVRVWWAVRGVPSSQPAGIDLIAFTG
ncbi:MAG TPA: hypothetical protein VEK76_02000 [Candidatus Binatia bacterium]|nr:hypothetical protein [Candidatus Binatia bacterium]